MGNIRKPVVPMVILLLLVLVMAFRWTKWEAVTTQTASDGVGKVSYRVDRWTGQQWIRIILLREGQATAFERAAFSRGIETKDLSNEAALAVVATREGAAWDSRKTATNVWYFAILVSGVWLILSLRRGRKNSPALATASSTAVSSTIGSPADSSPAGCPGSNSSDTGPEQRSWPPWRKNETLPKKFSVRYKTKPSPGSKVVDDRWEVAGDRWAKVGPPPTHDANVPVELQYQMMVNAYQYLKKNGELPPSLKKWPELEWILGEELGKDGI